MEREKTAKKYNPIHMFLTPKLRKWTAIICYQWYDEKTNKQTNKHAYYRVHVLFLIR